MKHLILSCLGLMCSLCAFSQGPSAELADEWLHPVELEETTLFSCPGDFDGDGFVGGDELVAFLSQYGLFYPGTDPCDRDLDDNLHVNILDLVLFLQVWNLPCP
jgi:hypothetical protein